MNLLKKVITFFTQSGQKVKVGESHSWLSQLFGGELNFFGDSQKLINESYGSNPYVFAIVDRIAQKIAKLPRTLIDTKTGEPIENPSREQQELKTLLENPNTFETQKSFYYRMASNMLLGNLYVYKELSFGFSSSDGLPSLLMSPITSDVTINEGRSVSLNVESYSFTFLNTSFNNIDPELILHLKRPNIIISTHEGLSTLKPSAPLWATSNEIFKSGFWLHLRKGIQGILFGKGSITMRPDEKKELQKHYDDTFGNNTNMGRVKIVSTEVDYKAMGVNPADLKSIEMNLDILRSTCAIWDVPSMLFGDVGANTFSNMGEAKTWFVSGPVLENAETLDEELNRWLVGDDAGYCYKVNKDSIPEYQKSKKQLTDNIVMLFEKGLLTVEEARIRIGNDLKTVPEELKTQTQTTIVDETQ